MEYKFLNVKCILILVYFYSHEYLQVSYTTLKYHPDAKVLYTDRSDRRTDRRTDPKQYIQLSVKSEDNIYSSSVVFQ